MRILKRIGSISFNFCIYTFILFILFAPHNGGVVAKKDLSNSQIYLVTPEQSDKNFYDTKYAIPIEDDALQTLIKEYVATQKPVLEIGIMVGDLPHYRIVLHNGPTRYIVYLGCIYVNEQVILDPDIYITKSGTGYRNNWFWQATPSDSMLHNRIFDIIKDFKGEAVQLP